ncbi:MAG: tRNA (adenosine(37)-N6)-threonylcarbamoyltransferase complex ATPase subunit type 1 TsaE [Lachnospiraceae bacterium]|nr:tRNA (adenosine(37)-N6)-threonylcarbamoyltransferase complex ATPase subunit type 1 TsaE [Lachnospiraceae bacterium]
MGKKASAGEIVCLNGELGTGKTVFAKGFAEGLGITEAVVSPTFTILREYTDGRLPLYHFDVYRIEDAGEMNELGYEEYFFGDGVTLIEWAGLIAELIPSSAVRVLIEKDEKEADDFRRITIRTRDEE